MDNQITSPELFQLYLKNNVQLGAADIFEATALAEGYNLETAVVEAQIGLADAFDYRALLEELRQCLTGVTLQVHVSKTAGCHDVYVYYRAQRPGFDKIVGITLMSVSTDKTRSTTIATEEYAGKINIVIDHHVVDDHHACFILRQTTNGIAETRRSIRKSTLDIAPDQHYPFLSDLVNDYLDKFLASSSTILVLLGPAGTGKSTLLRNLIVRSGQPASLVYDPDTIVSTGTLDHFYSSNHKIMALEDADAFIGRRTEGNTHLSAYLNYADGIIKDPTKKIVISTNLGSKSKIDEALIREGRCYDIITFRELTQFEADVVREINGLPPKNFGGPVTLARALNKGGDELEQERSFKTGFAA